MNKTKRNASVVKDSNTQARTASETGKLLFNLTRKDIRYLFSGYIDSDIRCTTAIFEAMEAIHEMNNNEEDISCEVSVHEVLSIIGLLDNARFDIAKCDPINEKVLTSEEISRANNHFQKIIDKINKVGIYDFISKVMYVSHIVKSKESIEDVLEAFGCVFSLYIAYERSRHNLPDDNSSKIIN